MCIYDNQCSVRQPNWAHCNTDSEKCALYHRVNRKTTIEETIHELGLCEGEIAKIQERMHDSLEYYSMLRKEGSFVDNYRAFFRLHAMMFYYED